MNWIGGFGAGAGLGVVYFGGLWLTVLGVMRRPSMAALVPASGAARLIVLGFGLAIVGRQGCAGILAALGGLWLSRWYLLRSIGGVRHG